MQRTKRLERPEPPVAGTADRAGRRSAVDAPLLRLGAALGVVVVLQVVMDRLHPHHVDPNQSAAVFREYAHSEHWTAVHLVQFVGTFLTLSRWSRSRGLFHDSRGSRVRWPSWAVSPQ